MTTKPNSKNAVLFCCIPSHEIINFLIETLRRHKYHVSLLVTCPLAFNYAMSTTGMPDMGKTIADVIDKVWDPPPVLAVTSTKQCEEIYCALDPDFALSYYFAYPISKKMLDCRAKVLNLHPGKLPIERGPFPGLWPTLEPERYSMDDLMATFHYMNEKVDCGPILKEVPLKKYYPEGTTLHTRPTGLLEVATPVFFEHLDEVIDLVDKGYEGTPQPQPTERPQALLGMGYGARVITDEERTVTSKMTKDEVLHLIRGLKETDGLTPPLFHWQGRRYWIERCAEWDEWPGKKDGETVEVGRVKRVGFDLVAMFEGGILRFAVKTK